MNEEILKKLLTSIGSITVKELSDGRWWSNFDSERYDVSSSVVAETKNDALLGNLETVLNLKFRVNGFEPLK